MSDLNSSDLEKRLREADLQALAAYRSGKGEAPVIYKAGGFVRAVEDTDRPMLFVASTEEEDRYGDLISVEGWELDNFRKNPVFLFAHQHNVAPIGLVPKVWKSAEEKALLATVRWDNDDPLAAFLKGKYQRGFMRAVSVGFRPIEFDDSQAPGAKSRGIHFKKHELLEISAVPIPANPRALQKAMEARKFSIMVPEEVTFAFANEPQPEPGASHLDFEAVKRAIRELKEEPVNG